MKTIAAIRSADSQHSAGSLPRWNFLDIVQTSYNLLRKNIREPQTHVCFNSVQANLFVAREASFVSTNVNNPAWPVAIERDARGPASVRFKESSLEVYTPSVELLNAIE